VRLCAGQQRRQHGGRRRVADAHVARDQQVSAAVDLLVRDQPPGADRLLGLLGGQGVLAVDAARPASHLVPAGLRRPGQVAVDAEVRDPDGGADLTGQDVDRRTAGQEVGHHLGGDLGRIGGDAG